MIQSIIHAFQRCKSHLRELFEYSLGLLLVRDAEWIVITEQIHRQVTRTIEQNTYLNSYDLHFDVDFMKFATNFVIG